MNNEQANLIARYKAKIDKAKVVRKKEPKKPYGLCLCGLKNTTYYYATKKLR